MVQSVFLSIYRFCLNDCFREGIPRLSHSEGLFLVLVCYFLENNIRVCPLFPVLKDASSHFKSLSEDSMLYTLCIILKTSIISPHS